MASLSHRVGRAAVAKSESLGRMRVGELESLREISTYTNLVACRA